MVEIEDMDSLSGQPVPAGCEQFELFSFVDLVQARMRRETVLGLGKKGPL